jgi:sec-independent protein translocase protein TatB
MLGIGFGEMILIAGIALIVFGPEKFPDFAKIVLRTVNDLRGYVDEIQKEVSKEIKPIKRELEQMSKYDPEKYIDALSKDVSKAVEKKPTGSGVSTSETTAPTEESSTPDPYMESQAVASDVDAVEQIGGCPIRKQQQAIQRQRKLPTALKTSGICPTRP